MDRVLVIIIIVILVYFFVYVNVRRSLGDVRDQPIKTLVRQASRWSMAAAQDQSAMIAVLHANYGAGYLWALRDIATDNEIKEATGIDVLKFRDEITKVQDTATKKMASLCPQYAPQSTYLSKLAGEL